jgi:glutamyl-tRNA reductase
MRLAVVGVSHRRAPVGLRERLRLTTEHAAHVGRLLAGEDGEAVALSTCNRTELYVADRDLAAATRRASDELVRLSGGAPSDVAPALEVRRDERAILHLFRVASGLDSLVLGDTQILGQVREAYEHARAADATGPILNRLFHDAVRVGKRARTETGIARGAVSVSSAAVALAAEAVGSLRGRHALVLGIGGAGALAARNLHSRGVASLTLVNRTPGRAEALAGALGARAVGLHELDEELRRADLVISATSAPGLVLAAERVARALPHRGGRPLALVDIAVPRDLDPAIDRLPGCRLYGVDDVGALSSAGHSERSHEAVRAETIVREETDLFRDWLRTLDVTPAIALLRERADAIRAAELARAEPRLEGLSPAERQAVESLTAQIVSKLLHQPSVRLKEAAADGRGSLYARVVGELFDATRYRSGEQPGDFAGVA